MRSAIRSKSGPEVSERTKRRRSAPALAGVGIDHPHQRVRVLGDVAPALVEELERQRDVRRVDVVDVAEVRRVGRAVARAREERRRHDALEAGGERFEAGHASDSGASGERRAGVGPRRLVEDRGHPQADRDARPRDPRLQRRPRQCRSTLADRDSDPTAPRRTARSPSRAWRALDEHALHLAGPLVGRPRETSAAWPLARGPAAPRRRRVRHVGHDVPAVGFHLDGQGAAAVRLEPLVAGAEWMARPSWRKAANCLVDHRVEDRV